MDLEEGVVYSVPLTFYTSTGTLWSLKSADISAEYLDNVVLVQKNEDGTYKVTFQIENYDKMDAFQVRRPGTVEEDTAAKNVALGDFNISDTFICSPSAKEGSTVEVNRPSSNI